MDWGAKAELAYLKVALGDSLAEFEDYERVTADNSSLLRTAGTEFDFRSQAAYAKGDAEAHFYY